MLHTDISATKQDRAVVTVKCKWEIQVFDSECAVRFVTRSAVLLPFRAFFTAVVGGY